MWRYFLLTSIAGLMGMVVLSAGTDPALSESNLPESKQADSRPLCPICTSANNDRAPYAEKAGNTLVRGALNFGFGWTELILQPAQEAKSGGNIISGVGKGLSHSFSRTLGGLGELLTFWTPKWKDRYVHFSQNCPLDTSTTQPNR